MWRVGLFLGFCHFAISNILLPRAVNLLCAVDNCTSPEIKSEIKNCWPDEGKMAWDSCMNKNGSCKLTEIGKINDCLMNAVYNMTDITVKLHRELRYKLFYTKALLDCAGDKITLKMLSCSMPPFSPLLQGKPVDSDEDL